MTGQRGLWPQPVIGEGRLDTTQLSQMVTWLDEEHRKDRAEIARLQQLLESQATEIREQARRIQDLEGRLANTQAQLARFSQLEQAIQQLKNEVSAMIDRLEEELLRSEREAERARLSDREAMSRAISEIRKELPRFNRIDEELNVRKVEDQRLSEALLELRQQVTTLQKEVEDRTRNIPYILEQRSQDAKRLAQIQQETVELFKRTDAVAGRLPAMEASIQRLSKAVEQIAPVSVELRRAQESFIEQVKLAQVEQERQIRDFQDEMASYRDEVEAQKKLVQAAAEAAEIGRRAARTIEQFQEEIRRDQSQVAELQRLAEERLRKEVEIFREEIEKRWQRETLNLQQRWQEQAQVNQDLSARFPPIVRQLKELRQHVDQLWRLQEEFGAYRLHEAQRWLDELEEALDAKDQIGQSSEGE
ncbi:MAG: hypothetical protein Kow0047_19560 [Anaerolineae bacterium]